MSRAVPRSKSASLPPHPLCSFPLPMASGGRWAAGRKRKRLADKRANYKWWQFKQTTHVHVSETRHAQCSGFCRIPAEVASARAPLQSAVDELAAAAAAEQSGEAAPGGEMAEMPHNVKRARLNQEMPNPPGGVTILPGAVCTSTKDRRQRNR